MPVRGYLWMMALLLPMAAMADEPDASRLVLDRWLAPAAAELAKHNAPAPQVEALADDAIQREFGAYRFYAVRFGGYPEGVRPPAPLKMNNLIAVSSSGSVTQVTNERQLEGFFQSQAEPIRQAADAKIVMHVWLTLLKELRQDGFYRFSVPDEMITVGATGAGITASGKVVVSKGGTGQIDATLTFGIDGRVEMTTLGENVMPDARPVR